jgi:hypothetical protein
VDNEDLLFRQSNRPYVYNPWLLPQSGDYRIENSVIPEFYSSRVCEFFPQAGIYKFKANFSLNGAYR